MAQLPAPERTGGSPRLRLRILVRTPGRGVNHAFPRLFTRRLPPGGSVRVLTSHFSLFTSHFSLPSAPVARWRQQRVARALYPRAAALRLIRSRHAAQFVFSLLTSHFRLLPSRGGSSALPGLFTRRLPPNGIGFLVFRMLWRTRSPLKRLDPIMQSVRSMSIGR